MRNLVQQTRLAPVFTLALVVGLAVVWPVARTSLRQSVAAAYNQSAQHEMAAHEVLEALARFDLPPRLLASVYGYAMVARGRSGQKSLDETELDRLYAITVAAVPGAPLPLDLRLKQRLGSSGLEVNLDDIEAMLVALRRATGPYFANANILESELALQLGDEPRARKAIIQASRIMVITAPKPGENQLTNAENLNSLIATFKSQFGAKPFDGLRLSK